MPYFIKTLRDTRTGRVAVQPPMEAPSGLTPYRLKHGNYGAECIQIYDTEYQAAKAYADELLFAKFANCPNEERIEELRKLTKNLTKLGFSRPAMSNLFGVNSHTHIAYQRGAVNVNPRYLAQLYILWSEISTTIDMVKRRLPAEGNCGVANKGRGGNPDIHLSAPYAK